MLCVVRITLPVFDVFTGLPTLTCGNKEPAAASLLMSARDIQLYRDLYGRPCSLSAASSGLDCFVLSRLQFLQSQPE